MPLTARRALFCSQNLLDGCQIQANVRASDHPDVPTRRSRNLWVLPGRARGNPKLGYMIFQDLLETANLMCQMPLDFKRFRSRKLKTPSLVALPI